MEVLQHPFSADQKTKDSYLTQKLKELTEYHRQHCVRYQNMLDGIGYEETKIFHYKDLPFLPVTLFKKLRLSSIDDTRDAHRILTSSGTGTKPRSQIVLDAETRTRQQQVLASIGSDFLGPKRMPMLVVDCPSTVKDAEKMSARTAAILGFSLFGSSRTYALKDEDMSLDLERIEDFLQQYGQQKFLVFGFTFVIWKYFVCELEKRGIRPDLSNGVLIHGGGWKKLASEAVSKEEYKKRIYAVSGIDTVMDYYGMAEQSGSIFVECAYGHLHCSDYSALLIRRAEDFSVCGTGEKGLIQVMSVVPKSYPGHSLLTEDEGRILGMDDCPCGRKGVYFEVLGRVKDAELRGCSEMIG